MLVIYSNSVLLSALQVATKGIYIQTFYLGGGMCMREDYFKAVNCACHKPRFCISFTLEITKPVQ